MSLKVVPPSAFSKQEFVSMLDEIAREGARKMLIHALKLEADEYVESFASERDESGKRLVVRNGVAKERTVTTGAGSFSVQAPRVDDRRDGHKFSSDILPPYLRKSPKVESLLPILYLKGLSTNDFQSALAEFLGEGVSGLSPASIVKLKKIWEDDFQFWQKRLITKKFVYIWADGVNVQVRLGEDKKVCLLVIIGATEDGDKELLAVEAGHRESKDSWLYVLNSLTSRGFTPPRVAVGDGALGFWAAVREASGFENVDEQRCWVHKIANVLDKLPKRLQTNAKTLLHEMMQAEALETCEKVRDQFFKLHRDKYPKAVECIEKSWSELTTYFKYPAAHWKHLRTTNPIESSFATVKLRTKVTKGAGSVKTATVMAFKLLSECQKRWRKISAPEEIKNVLAGVEYKDGVMVAPPSTHHETAVS